MSGPAAVASASVHIGRRALYDAGSTVVGHELVVRGAHTGGLSRPGDRLGDTTTLDAAHLDAAHLVDEALTEVLDSFPVEVLLPHRFGFVTLTLPYLTGGRPVPFAASQAGVEITRDVAVDDDVVGAVIALREAGYRIAREVDPRDPEPDRLLPLADVVKVDVRGGERDLPDLTGTRHPQLLADGVGDAATLARCLQRGFTVFQGPWLDRPRAPGSEALTPSTALSMRLMGLLSRSDPDFGEIERMVRRDAGLSYRVLRLVNSSAAGLPRQVHSLREALVMVGTRRLHAWLVLISLAGVAADAEQLQEAIARARTCELLAPSRAGAAPDSAFLVGLLHALVGLLGSSADVVGQELGVAPDLAAALRGDPGPLGDVLRAVLAHETDDDATVADLGFDVLALSRVRLTAIGWSIAAARSATEDT